MTSLFIDSEGDMEHCIDYCKMLSTIQGRKHLTLAFPSKHMYNIFMKNLHRDLLTDKRVPDNVDIDCDIILPYWEPDDE